MSWLVWLIISMFLNSLEQVLNRHFLSRTPRSWAYLLGYNLGALVLIMFFISPGQFFLDIGVCLQLLLSGFLWFLACYYNFKANESAEISDTALLGQLQLVLLFFSGIFLFGEALTAAKLSGTCLILAGIGTTISLSSIRLKQGFAFKLVSTIAMSAALLIDKNLVAKLPAAVVTVSGFAVPFILAVFLRPSRLMEGVVIARKISFANIGMGAIAGFSYLALIQALSKQELSIIIPAYQAHILLTLVLAHLFLGEKITTLARVVASLFIVSGSVLITW